MHVFSAGVTLAIEAQGTPDPDSRLLECIMESKRLLREVQRQNKLASKALLMLDELIAV